MTDRTVRQDLPSVGIHAWGSPSLAFLRSLAPLGVPCRVYGPGGKSIASASRWASGASPAPPIDSSDALADWLEAAVTTNEFEYLAPTSDYTAFAAAEVQRRLGRTVGLLGEPEATLDCLFKSRFGPAAADAGMAPPPEAHPTSRAELSAVAEALGYPVVLKGRTHAGVGLWRGGVAWDEECLDHLLESLTVTPGNDTALAVDPHLLLPTVQKFIKSATTETVSISGFIAQDGEAKAVSHCIRRAAAGMTGIGSLFVSTEPEPFTELAIDVVRSVQQAGIFELEIIVDRATGETWALDLNPRGFGQMALDIGRGNDLPVLWYNDLTGADLTPRPAPRRPPREWRVGLPYYADRAVHALMGPKRGRAVRDLLTAPFVPHVDGDHAWNDPAPGVFAMYRHLRHPGGMIRPVLEQRSSETG